MSRLEILTGILTLTLPALFAPNWILALPLTNVAAICMITASIVYAELHPCRTRKDHIIFFPNCFPNINCKQLKLRFAFYLFFLKKGSNLFSQ